MSNGWMAKNQHFDDHLQHPKDEDGYGPWNVGFFAIQSFDVAGTPEHFIIHSRREISRSYMKFIYIRSLEIPFFHMSCCKCIFILNSGKKARTYPTRKFLKNYLQLIFRLHGNKDNECVQSFALDISRTVHPGSLEGNIFCFTFLPASLLSCTWPNYLEPSSSNILSPKV
jgi:hypothetical protein